MCVFFTDFHKQPTTCDLFLPIRDVDLDPVILHQNINDVWLQHVILRIDHLGKLLGSVWVSKVHELVSPSEDVVIALPIASVRWTFDVVLLALGIKVEVP